MPEDFEFEPESQDSAEVTLPGEQQEVEPTDSQTAPTENEAQPTETEIKDNPAWKDILTPVPEQFHPHLKGHLSRMEQYAQEAQQRFTPYKQFAENNITPEILQQGIQLMQAFNQNPRAIYDYLAQAYNFQQQENQSQDQKRDNAQENLELGEEQSDIFKDPRVQALANQSAFAAQQVQLMQEQAMQAQMSAQVDRELNALAAHPQYRSIPTDVVIRQALGMAAAEEARTGREVPADVMAAAKFLWDSGAFQSRSQRPLPPNLSRSNAGVPSDGDPLEGIGSKSRQQRTALVAEMMKQLDK